MWTFSRDPDKRIRRLTEKKDVPRLIALFERASDEAVAVAAAKALGEIGDARAAKPLIDSLRHVVVRGDGTWSMDALQASVAEALTKMGAPVIPELIHVIEHAGDREWRLLLLAEAVLPQLGAPAVEALARLTTHADRRARARAVRLLGATVPLVDAGGLFIGLMADHPALAQGLLEDGFAQPGVIRVVSKLLDQTNPHPAAAIMGENTYHDAIKALKDALRDPDEEVRKTARKALEDIQEETDDDSG